MCNQKVHGKITACGVTGHAPWRSWLLATLLLLQSITNPLLAAPTPFKAIYKANYKGIPIVGEGVRELIRLEADTFKLSASVDSFLIQVAEESVFQWSNNNQLIPIEYQYRRRGIGSDRDAVLKFDWKKHQVLNNVQAKPWKMAIKTGVMDKLGYQIQLRDDLLQNPELYDTAQQLNYAIADGGRLKDYQFNIVSQELIDTPVGKLRTLKLARETNKDERTTVFWLALDWEFLLVRLEQSESGKGTLNLYLDHAEMDGVDVTGDQSL